MDSNSGSYERAVMEMELKEATHFWKHDFPKISVAFFIAVLLIIGIGVV